MFQLLVMIWSICSRTGTIFYFKKKTQTYNYNSHEMIKKHNMKLESDLAKLKSKYEDEIAQMRASHSQLKSLFMKNSF